MFPFSFSWEYAEARPPLPLPIQNNYNSFVHRQLASNTPVADCQNDLGSLFSSSTGTSLNHIPNKLLIANYYLKLLFYETRPKST